MVDEMEKAGHRPHLANPTEAKKRMGKTNKTDALDAKGLAILLHNGTLPESWIPPGELRDRRELLRTRMALRDLRSSLKHRIDADFDRYGSRPQGSAICSASKAASTSTRHWTGCLATQRP
jgi:transposase